MKHCLHWSAGRLEVPLIHEGPLPSLGHALEWRPSPGLLYLFQIIFELQELDLIGNSVIIKLTTSIMLVLSLKFNLLVLLLLLFKFLDERIRIYCFSFEPVVLHAQRDFVTGNPDIEIRIFTRKLFKFEEGKKKKLLLIYIDE